MGPNRAHLTLEAFTQVGGREVCVDSEKTVRSDTPTICAVEAERSVVDSLTTTAARVPFLALAPGACSLSVTHTASGQVASLQFDVDPVPVQEWGWAATCEVEPGTTCGVTCASIACWEPASCSRSPGGTMSCLYARDLTDPSPECADETGMELSTSPSASLCWFSPP
jgi:hypothetical protein